ncbi:hypothetical protein [Sodalinema gerasimenkoae]|nr:hypothetical protein [Sodalinema gerasimenkoae]
MLHGEAAIATDPPSTNEFIAIITTVTSEELVKAEWLALSGLGDRKGHR